MTRRSIVFLILVVAVAVARAQSPEHQACEQGDVEACWTIGKRHYTVGKEQDDPDEIAMALTYLEKACDLGKGHACNIVGYSHASRLGNLNEDKVLAQNYYRKACDLGFELGCKNSKLMRSNGWIYPPEKDLDEIALSKCERGNPKSCYDVVTALLGRDPVDESAKEAAPYLEKSCRGGHGQACVELAYLHKEGLGVTYDLTLTRMHREKACAAGNFAGCDHLGWDYRIGRNGAPKDEWQSQMYFRKACDLGWSDACDRVKKTD